MFTYEIIQDGVKCAAKFNGDLDIDVTEILQDELSPMLMTSKSVDIDFANVPFVDSSGIGLLITLVNRLREAGISVTISHVSPEIMQVFSMLQVPEIVGHDVFADQNCS